MTWRALTLALAVATTVAATKTVTVRDLDGHTWTPVTPAPGAINVLFFVSKDCPITRRYSPEIDRIASDYSARNVHAFFIYADVDVSADEVRDNLRSFHPGSSVPAVIDKGLVLTTTVGVTVTPEVAVFTARGRVYRGRIDDLYVTAGQARRDATSHDLRDALEDILAGRPIAHPDTRAIGCFIEKPKGTS